MRPLNFNQFPNQTNAPTSDDRGVRSVFEAIISRNTPIAPGGNSDGVPLAEVGARGCRFPIRRDHHGTSFCAVEVGGGAWRPGSVNGCYCEFHREFLAGQPRVNTVDEGVA